MALSKKEVDHIAELARLQLSPQEKEVFRRQLSGILDHVARLQKLDTSAIAPTSSVLATHSAMREDKARPGLGIGAVLENAPDHEDRQFRVPPVLE